MEENKGQGALEYLLTYGWAILVVIIVGLVLWRSGVFGTSLTGASGFDVLIPSEWKFDNETTATSQVVWRNVAGQALKTVNITYSGDCTNATVYLGTLAAGSETVSTFACVPTCTAPGSATVDVSIAYKTTAGITHTTVGKIYANCE